jgi:hypothetical protein
VPPIGQTAAGQTAAILDLVSRLPYSESTLNLQAQAALATLQLEDCNPTDAQQNQLATKLQGLLDAMMTDPEYVRAQEAIQAILEKDFETQFPPPPPPGVPACELTETSSGPACVAFNLSGTQYCALRQNTVGPKFCAIATSPNPPMRPPDEFSWAHVAIGDIILRRATDARWQTLAYAIKYTHSANWHGDRVLYEAIREGVVLTSLKEWFAVADDVAIGSENGEFAEFAGSALSRSEERYGTDGRTPFDFGFLGIGGKHYNKSDDSHGLYCSQLTWIIHNRYLGVDLDSQDWRVATGLVARYGVLGAVVLGPFGALLGGSVGELVARRAVFPDEIFWSPHVDWYYIGKSPQEPAMD